jgi:tetratricopeptide (TPR) repeat protein
LAEAYTSVGLAMFHEWDWQGCEQKFARAIELNSNSVDARIFYSWYLCMSGRLEEGLEQTQRALELDPLSSFVGAIQAWALILLGRFDPAIRQLNSILEMDPNFLMAHAELGHAYCGLGRHDEAIASVQKGGWRKMLVALTCAMAGRLEEARRLMEDLLSTGDLTHERPSEIAVLYVMIGERDKAAIWFEKAYEERDYMAAMHCAANWFPLGDDKLIHDHLRRMGLKR